jgi:hypothetical protein
VPVALALPPLNPVQTLGRNVLTLILTILSPFRFFVLSLSVVPRWPGSPQGEKCRWKVRLENPYLFRTYGCRNVVEK